MQASSLSPNQPPQVTQAAQANKKTELTEARKQTESRNATIKEEDRAQAKKAEAEHKSQVQKTQEPKPTVNTSGQKVGTLINVEA